MNDVFNIIRFGKLVKKTLWERPVQLFGFPGLVLLFTSVVYAVIKTLSGFEEGQMASFLLGLVGGGAFFASFMFNYFSSSASGSSYLTLPASHFEKWLCGALMMALFPFIFIVFFHFLDQTFVAIYYKSLDPKNPYYKELYDAVHSLPLDGFFASKTYILYLNCTGLMLIGSLYFNKAAFIKVAIIGLTLFIGSIFLDLFLAKIVFVSVDRAVPFYCVFIKADKDFGKVLLPGQASVLVDILFIYLLPSLLWFSTLVRLHEKEF